MAKLEGGHRNIIGSNMEFNKQFIQQEFQFSNFIFPFIKYYFRFFRSITP